MKCDNCDGKGEIPDPSEGSSIASVIFMVVLVAFLVWSFSGCSSCMRNPLGL